MIVETEKYVFGGSCLAHLNRKTVFVPFSLPNERLKIEIVEEKKDYINAKIVDIIEASPHRVMPKCPHFYTCGGCSLQMISCKEQHLLRLESVKEIFERSHLELNFPFEFICERDWEYRNRFQFQVREGISLMGRASKETVRIKECPIAVKEIGEYISKNSIFDDNSMGSVFKENRLEKITSQKGVYKKYTSKSDVCGFRTHIFAFNGKVWFEGKKENVSISILGHDFRFAPSAFFQSNVQMLCRLVEILGEHIGHPKRFLDFYSGVGTFSVFFAHRIDEVHLVEWNKEALQYAKKNLMPVLQNKKGVRCFFHAIKSQEWNKMEESKLFYDIAIVDPPRSGIDKNSLEWFCKKHVKKILYVSCDPVTFANNANVLIRDGGYRLEKYYLLDFYPQTHHVESLGIFSL